MSLTLQVSVSDVNVHSESDLEQAQTDGRTNSGLNCRAGPRPAEDKPAVRIPAAAELETPPGDKIIHVHVNKAATQGVTSLHRNSLDNPLCYKTLPYMLGWITMSRGIR